MGGVSSLLAPGPGMVWTSLGGMALAVALWGASEGGPVLILASFGGLALAGALWGSTQGGQVRGESHNCFNSLPRLQLPGEPLVCSWNIPWIQRIYVLSTCNFVFQDHH